jgi:hypothetical protein
MRTNPNLAPSGWHWLSAKRTCEPCCPPVASPVRTCGQDCLKRKSDCEDHACHGAYRACNARSANFPYIKDPVYLGLCFLFLQPIALQCLDLISKPPRCISISMTTSLPLAHCLLCLMHTTTVQVSLTSSLLFDYHTNMTIEQTMSPTHGLPVSPRGPSPIVRP